MDDLLDHPMLQDLSFERAINYAVEFMHIVGVPTAFENKTEDLTVEEYATTIPNDCFRILALKKGATSLALNTSTSVYGTSKEGNTSSMYTIRGNQIHTSFKEGTIQIAYLAMPIDDEGYPTIPDMAAYIRALELYIKKKWFTILFDLGKINVSIYNNVKQEYAFAVGQAQNKLIMPSLDEMEAFTNMWNSLLPKQGVHASGYGNLGIRELKKF